MALRPYDRVTDPSQSRSDDYILHGYSMTKAWSSIMHLHTH